jgi:hypothetical protein
VRFSSLPGHDRIHDPWPLVDASDYLIEVVNLYHASAQTFGTAPPRLVVSRTMIASVVSATPTQLPPLAPP